MKKKMFMIVAIKKKIKTKMNIGEEMKFFHLEIKISMGKWGKKEEI
jgi:hypothetical protein